jgi:hypothetical protein
LIARRQHAFLTKNFVLYKVLRNRINRIRKSLRKQYYLDKVDKLKHENPANWWKMIKLISGLQSPEMNLFDHMTFSGENVDITLLPNVINGFLSDMTSSVEPLYFSRLKEIRSRLPVTTPNEFIVGVDEIFNQLSHVHIRKAVGPDGIPNKILRDLADIIAGPVASIINSSIRQGVVPFQWKLSRINPLAKTFPPVSVENDIRPIAITNTLAKISERFVSKFFNEHFEDHLDDNQFGSTSSRSTTEALIHTMHDLFLASEKPGNIIRLLFVDFRKAFDLINHNVLMDKFCSYNFPDHVTVWSLDFLYNRSQFVKLGSLVSDTVMVNAGTAQGTVSGPNNFKMLINDLKFSTGYMKYVDDTTVYTFSGDVGDMSLQVAADDLVKWSRTNGLVINESKTKEMVIYFGRKFNRENDIPHTVINNKVIDRVNSFKLLGVYISSDLSWDFHVDYMIKKVVKRMFCIRTLVHSGVGHEDIVHVYCSVIRSVLEYACPVWHPGLTKKLSKEIESIQKRCLKLVFPMLSYSQALNEAKLDRLDVRREAITKQMFNKMKAPNHVLHSLLPPERQLDFDFRSSYLYSIPLSKKMRYGRDIVPYCISKR